MTENSSANKKFWLVIVICFTVLVILAAGAMIKKQTSLSKAVAMPELPLAVKTVVVEHGRVEHSIPALATVKSAATVQIKAEAGGVIQQLYFREGDIVQAGQQMAIIDSREQDAQLQAAVARKESAGSQVNAMTANLKALMSQLDSLKINLDYWTKEQDRTEKLFEAKAMTQSALDNIKNRRAEAESRLNTLQAQILAQKSQISSLESQQKAAVKDVQVWQVRRDYSEIKAPVAGIVSARLQEEGNRIMPGSTVFHVEDIQLTRLVMQIPQESAGLVRKGQKVCLCDKGMPEFTVTRIYPVQNELRQLTVEADYHGLIEGVAFDMIIPVRINVKSEEGSVIPPDARFVNFARTDEFYVFHIVGDRAIRKSLSAKLTGDLGMAVVGSESLAAGSVLAVGSYLENVRLPASFSVEVVR